MPDDYRGTMQRIAAMLRQRGDIPPDVCGEVDSLSAEWESESPDLSELERCKVALWSYLDAKHGNSTTIADAQDRSVRAALCLAEPPGQYDEQDLEEWANRMLT
jgi:hypothetical protein